MRIIKWLVVPVLVAVGLALPAVAGEKSSKVTPAPDPKIGEKIRTAFCRPIYAQPLPDGGGFRSELFQMAMTLERINTLLEFSLLRNGGPTQLPYFPGGGGGVYPTPVPTTFPAGGVPVAAAESGLNNIALMMLLQGQGDLLGSIDRGRPIGELRQQLSDIQRAIDRLGISRCPGCDGPIPPRPMPYMSPLGGPIGLQLQMQQGYSGKQVTTYPASKEK